MKKYFLHTGKTQSGPFTLDELKQQGLRGTTMVWFDGIENWTEAQKIDELKSFVVATPPPFETTNPLNQTFDKAKKVLDKDYVNEIEKKIPNSTGKKIFKLSLIVLALIGLFFVFDFIRPTQESKERKHPVDFLAISEASLSYSRYSMDPNKRWYISGYLKNNARITTYKDVKVEMEFFTRSNTSLGKTTIVVYKLFPPNKIEDRFDNKTSFDAYLDIEPPENTDINQTKFKLIDAEIQELTTQN